MFNKALLTIKNKQIKDSLTKEQRVEQYITEHYKVIKMNFVFQ